ncbi:MAG: DUF3109 family protein, partial [Xanthomarina sp.]
GIFYVDTTNEMVTTLVNNAECAFAVFDSKGISKCGIEDAYNAGKTTFKKPISCHLYPIRVVNKKEIKIINYDRWDVCDPACVLGEALNVKTFRFLKEPIIRAFGVEFYNELEIVDAEISNSKF